MLVAIICVIAILAFLIVLCVIYSDNIKSYLKDKKAKKSKSKNNPKPKPAEVKVEEFIPLKNVNYDEERDASLYELFKEDLDEVEEIEESSSIQTPDFDDYLKNKDHYPRALSSNFNKYLNTIDPNSKKPISQQIQELSPELKALLLDSTLKRRDDV